MTCRSGAKSSILRKVVLGDDVSARRTKSQRISSRSVERNQEKESHFPWEIKMEIALLGTV